MVRPGAILVAVSMSLGAHAQANPPQPNTYVHLDAHCKEVHPGDSVSYSLTIEGLAGAANVSADLQMRPSHEVLVPRGGLPSPDFRNLGGGGMSEVNNPGAGTYTFTFVVPKEIYSGRYHGVDVLVRANRAVSTPDDRNYIDVSRHTRKRVHAFCLNVVSDYGTPEQKPEVIDFQPGVIVPRR